MILAAEVPDKRKGEISFHGRLRAVTKVDLAAYIAVIVIENNLLGFTQLQNACTRPQTGQCSQCVQLLAK